jgi:hypothetical protein
MRIGAFEVREPLPELKAPHAIATLRPWVDAGSVGTLTMDRLETLFGARKLGKVARPGSYFDFTRYRPFMRLKDGVHVVEIPNSVLSYGLSGDENDFIFLRLLEPHMQGEMYAISIWQLLKKLGIRRYTLIGSMYDLVPSTRPLLISGSAAGQQAVLDLQSTRFRPSNYQGPSTICHLVSQEAHKAGVETMVLLVHLPQYTELEEDYMGLITMLQVMHSLYHIPIDSADIRKAEEQQKGVEAIVKEDSKLKEIETQLEDAYDATAGSKDTAAKPLLSSEVENFLKEMENRFKEP